MTEHNPTSFPKSVIKLVKKSLRSDKALKLLEKVVFSGALGKDISSLLGTTQAVDLIEGGVKVNALPERASAVINHRIAIERLVVSLPYSV